MKEGMNQVGVVLIGLTILSVMVFFSIKRNQIAEHGRYTIGTTVGRNGKFIKFKYEVLGDEYLNESQILKDKPKNKGGRYFVKFLPDDIGYSEIFIDKPVPDSIKEAPAEGWEEIPK